MSSDGTVPFWFSAGFLVLLCWAGFAFFDHIAGFRTDISDPSLRSDFLASGGGGNLADDALQMGHRIYAKNCLICHQTSGGGAGSQYPPLAGSEWVLSRDGHTDRQLVLILLYGLQGPIRVRNVVYNGNMPGWHHFSDTEIAAVLSYIRFNWGNRAAPFTAEEVSSIRKSVSFRIEPWTWQELQNPLPSDNTP